MCTLYYVLFFLGFFSLAQLNKQKTSNYDQHELAKETEQLSRKYKEPPFDCANKRLTFTCSIRVGPISSVACKSHTWNSYNGYHALGPVK